MLPTSPPDEKRRRATDYPDSSNGLPGAHYSTEQHLDAEIGRRPTLDRGPALARELVDRRAELNFI
jgi:hypothetical protein